MVAMLNSRNRGRECLELLRRFYRVVLLTNSSSNELLVETSEVRSLLFKSVQDQKAPRKIASFFQYLLALLTRGANGDLSFVRVELASSFEPWLAFALCPLLVQCGSLSSYKKNLSSLVAWTTVPLPASSDDSNPSDTVPVRREEKRREEKRREEKRREEEVFVFLFFCVLCFVFCFLFFFLTPHRLSRFRLLFVEWLSWPKWIAVLSSIRLIFDHLKPT